MGSHDPRTLIRRGGAGAGQIYTRKFAQFGNNSAAVLPLQVFLKKRVLPQRRPAAPATMPPCARRPSSHHRIAIQPQHALAPYEDVMSEDVMYEDVMYEDVMY